MPGLIPGPWCYQVTLDLKQQAQARRVGVSPAALPQGVFLGAGPFRHLGHVSLQAPTRHYGLASSPPLSLAGGSGHTRAQ